MLVLINGTPVSTGSPFYLFIFLKYLTMADTLLLKNKYGGKELEVGEIDRDNDEITFYVNWGQNQFISTELTRQQLKQLIEHLLKQL